MTTKRDSINEYDLVWGAPTGYGAEQPPQGKYPPPHSIGFKAWALRKLHIRECTAAVVTIDGVYQETLRSGEVSLSRYPFFNRCEIYWVDMRDRDLVVETVDEFVVMKPVPIHIDLAVSVKYRVAEPRVVSLEIKAPLTALYDYTIEAMRHASSKYKFQDFLLGDPTSSSIYKHLKNRNVEAYLGIEVIDVLTTSISVSDRDICLMQDEVLSTNESLEELSDKSRRRVNEMQAQIREWETHNDIAASLELSPLYSSKLSPEIYKRMYENSWVTDQFGKRLALEVSLLRENGFDVSMQKDEKNHYLQVRLDEQLKVYFICTQGYPTEPPQLVVEYRGKEELYTSSTIQNWSNHSSLAEVLQEIVDYYCTGL